MLKRLDQKCAQESSEELFPVNKSGGSPPKAKERFSGVNTSDVSP
jgi:hypothetical protein